MIKFQCIVKLETMTSQLASGGSGSSGSSSSSGGSGPHASEIAQIKKTVGGQILSGGNNVGSGTFAAFISQLQQAQSNAAVGLPAAIPSHFPSARYHFADLETSQLTTVFSMPGVKRIKIQIDKGFTGVKIVSIPNRKGAAYTSAKAVAYNFMGAVSFDLFDPTWTRGRGGLSLEGYRREKGSSFTFHSNLTDTSTGGVQKLVSGIIGILPPKVIFDMEILDGAEAQKEEVYQMVQELLSRSKSDPSYLQDLQARVSRGA